MTRFQSYLFHASRILDDYNGTFPFHSFVKQYFSGQKKFGSTDRRIITHLCYCYFRLGKALSELQKEERLLLSLLLCSQSTNIVLNALRPEWDALTTVPLAEKISKLQFSFSVEDIFPWTNELSEGIDAKAFCASFLQQPKLFLRLRPGKENQVLTKLQVAGISFEKIGEHALALPASSKLDDVLQLNNEALVQDLSSQRVASFFPEMDPGSVVWDCCSGSGGKSILLYDSLPGIILTASDKRESIIVNLKTRFREAGIRQYKALVLDLEKETLPGNIRFDLIMADVPCTGSGTWSRTPEQLYFHEPSAIAKYQLLQRKIVERIIPSLKKGNQLLYITCSVFRQENEENIKWAEEKFGLTTKKLDTIRGYTLGADTMFAALLTL